MIKDKNTEIIIKEAKKLGIKVEVIYPQEKIIALIKGKKRFLVQRDFRINLDRFGTRNIPLFKDATYFFWQQNNIPIPKTVTAFSFREAKKRLRKIPLPMVIKDAHDSQSRNVWVNVSNYKKAILVLKNLFSLPRIGTVIIQEFVRGKEFRILILKNKILGIAQLIPPSVAGDGKSTIKKLIKKLEKETNSKINIDQEMKNLIKSQGLSLVSILPFKQKIFLREYSKLSEGGRIKSFPSGLIHPEIKKMCLRATRVTGLELGGLDIITDNLSCSPKKQKIKFIEINSRPDLYIHHLPHQGKPVNVTKEILKYIFKL